MDERTLGRKIADSHIGYIFCWANDRHTQDDKPDHAHYSQYEVCGNIVCRMAWWLENQLRYGGKAKG